jgi:hypothetical protein
MHPTQIAKCREAIRECVRYCDEAEGDVPIPSELFDSDGELDLDHIFCSKCRGNESDEVRGRVGVGAWGWCDLCLAGGDGVVCGGGGQSRVLLAAISVHTSAGRQGAHPPPWLPACTSLAPEPPTPHRHRHTPICVRNRRTTSSCATACATAPTTCAAWCPPSTPRSCPRTRAGCAPPATARRAALNAVLPAVLRAVPFFV